jgi:arylsulfatase
MDPLPVLLGKTSKSPHKSFFFQYEKHAALRKGDWKIVRTDPGQPWQLYNLKEDISENKNIAAENPRIVEELNAAYNAKQQEIMEYLKTESADIR